MDVPETHYARTPDGINIAYQALGEGPRDILFAPSETCIDVMWDEPSFAHALHRLARLGRLICLDFRGFGGSDPVPLAALPTPELWMDDARVVLDAVGSTTAHVVATGGSGFIGMLFAATYPERTESLVLIDAAARTIWAEDYPGVPVELVDAYIRWVEGEWGTGAVTAAIAPSRAGDAAFRRWAGRFERGSHSRSFTSVLLSWLANLDLRAVLPAIRVPTLVLHREASQVRMPASSQYLADHIVGARLASVSGTDSTFFTEEADAFLDHIEEFVTGVPPVREPDRALATVLFTDIVASTEHATRLGDQRWRQLLDQHDDIAARELDRHRGRKVNPTGDGMLATFDGPARAVRCAQAIVAAVRPLGIEVRAGVHTGEVELRGDDIGGIAVHIGQRVSALAGPGEVLVSRTVTDLVAGSGLEFEERGEHELKGVPGKWAIYAVR